LAAATVAVAVDNAAAATDEASDERDEEFELGDNAPVGNTLLPSW
jgi:hypothetical protein